MPYLHLDTVASHPAALKRDLAVRLGKTYADAMQTTPDLVNVAFRELGEGNIWNCGSNPPRPSAVLSCEIRRGRPPEQRERLGKALMAVLVETLGLDPTLTAIEMTQHAGDEIYLENYIDGRLEGGLGKDWSPNEEKGQSMMESIIEDKRAEHAH
jgi:phenylpyruvate tautomerase PptA (4-oxalocrotonate tautomerase family)